MLNYKFNFWLKTLFVVLFVGFLEAEDFEVKFEELSTISSNDLVCVDGFYYVFLKIDDSYELMKLFKVNNENITPVSCDTDI